MAGRGPAPKGSRSRTRDEKEKTLLRADGEKRGYGLPANVLGRDEDGNYIKWHSMTKRWWDHWRNSPQATRMLSEPDWDFLLDTALMHHQMWAKGRWDFASEVRLRVAKFGATPEDRLRLRADIEVPDVHAVGSAPGASVTSIASRRDRLT